MGVFKVLYKWSAHSHVYQLMSAAYAQDRLVLRLVHFKKLKFRAVALVVDIHGGGIFLSVY